MKLHLPPMTILTAFVVALVPVQAAFAHVRVTPSEVSTATYQVFTVNVPNEKTIPTVSVEVDMPQGVSGVTPTNKAGWQVRIEKEGSGSDASVKSLTWTGGKIGDGTRDEFTFSAKTPDGAGDLKWKAYQTYSDGTVVAWDKEESDDHGHGHDSDTGPLSVTSVVSDDSGASGSSSEDDTNANLDRAFYVAIAGVILGLVAVFLATRKKS